MALVVASIAAAGCATVGGAAVGVMCAMQQVAEQPKVAAPAPAKAAALEESNEHLMVGFTMAEARKLADMGQEVAVAKKPQEILSGLQRGNARFWTGAAQRPDRSAFERRALISKQFPHTAILSCSDSRVPTEIVFDQGLGDMFVVRVAGNIVEVGTAASLQYAVNHLKVKVLVVMGHEGCGAVKAAGMPDETLKTFDPALCQCLNHIKMGLDFDRLACVHDPRSHDREAVVTNVKRQVEALTEDVRIMDKVRAGELIVIGAFYEISSGIVDFFFEVSAEASLPDKMPAKGVQSSYDPVKKMERQTSAEERARN